MALDASRLEKRATILDFVAPFLAKAQKKKDQEEELKMVLAKALAEQQAKDAFPSADDQAKKRVMTMASEAGRVPSPMGGYNPQEREAGIPGQVQEAAQSREMEFLKYILPRSSATASELLTPIMFDPNTRQYLDTSGNKVDKVPRGTPVRNAPLGAETLRGQSAARSEGAGTGRQKVIDQARSAQAQINTIYDIADRDLPAFADDPDNPLPEGTEAIGRGIGRKIISKVGGNETARAFLETDVANARQAIRGLGEVGVLTDKDVADAIKVLPSSTDSVTVRQRKRENLNQLIEAKIRIYEAAKAGTTATTEVGTSQGRLRVRRADGKTGTIDAADFDPAKYERL